MSAQLGRRAVALGGLAAPFGFTRNAWAQGRSINLGMYGGVQGEIMRRQVVPRFERAMNCRVYATEGVTLGQIAVLRTQRGNPQYSVMFMDDVGIPICRAENLIAQMTPEKVPNLARMRPSFVFDGGYGAAFSVNACMPYYNTQTSRAIQSYGEIWDARYRGRYLMVTPKQSQSVYLAIIAASLVTGKPFAEAQYLLDSAWPKLTELKPNVMTIYENATAILLMAQGQADLGGPEFAKTVLPYVIRGAPIEVCYPREGAFAGINCVTLVNNGPQPELAAAFVDHMLSPDIQKLIAEETLAAPAIRDVTLSAAVAPRVPYAASTADDMGLFIIDWSYINPRRGQILERLNQIFGA